MQPQLGIWKPFENRLCRRRTEAESIDQALSLQDVAGHKALGFAVKTVRTCMLLLLAIYIYMHFNNSDSKLFVVGIFYLVPPKLF